MQYKSALPAVKQKVEVHRGAVYYFPVGTGNDPAVGVGRAEIIRLTPDNNRYRASIGPSGARFRHPENRRNPLLFLAF